MPPDQRDDHKDDHKDDQRYHRGRDKLKQMMGDVGEQALDNIARMARYVAEFVFGDVHSRPALDLKTREIAAVVSLVTRGGAEPQLRAHLHAALNVGCSQEEIIELMIEMAVYAGFPAALNGLYAARDVFAEHKAKSPR
jgi:4-carboxymuconolactone decarboxylase